MCVMVQSIKSCNRYTDCNNINNADVQFVYVFAKLCVGMCECVYAKEGGK